MIDSIDNIDEVMDNNDLTLVYLVNPSEVTVSQLLYKIDVYDPTNDRLIKYLALFPFSITK